VRGFGLFACTNRDPPVSATASSGGRRYCTLQYLLPRLLNSVHYKCFPRFVRWVRCWPSCTVRACCNVCPASHRRTAGTAALRCTHSCPGFPVFEEVQSLLPECCTLW
jgi:hypothetical protein